MKVLAHSDFLVFLKQFFFPTNNYLESWSDGKPLGWKGSVEVICYKLKQKAGHWTGLNRAPSSLVFNISTKGDPTPSLETSSNV